MALFSDPIPRAYLAALESVAETQTAGELYTSSYYNLWPTRSDQSADKVKGPQRALFPHFYKALVQEHFSVFLHQQGGVPFSGSFFLDPEFKDTATGRVAFKVLEMFWDETEWRSGNLIDLPSYVSSNIKASGQAPEFRERTITKEQFFRELLFPKLKQGNPALEARDRNRLVLHALLSDASGLLQGLVKSHACVPCRPDGQLHSPARLIHPDRRAAPLFSQDDGRFPQGGDEADFSSSVALGQLSKLGMVGDKVSREELLERARSVETAAPATTAWQRAKAIVRYLPSLGEEMTSYAEDLSDVRFLPVLEKPNDWPLQWFGEGKTFTAPSAAYSKHLKDLVGCKAAIFDEESMDFSPTDWRTLATLGVTNYKWPSDTRLTKCTVDQLIGISADPDSLSPNNTKVVSNICKEIYKHLDSFCQYDRGNRYQDHRQVMEELKGRAVVWTRHGFQAADSLATGDCDDFEPYLIYVNGHSWNCHKFFSFLGVRAK